MCGAGEFVSLVLIRKPAVRSYVDAEEEKRVNQFTVTTNAGLTRLAVERQQRLRDSMCELNTPVLLVLDSVNIQYATGASNMTIFSTRTPARYLLLFAEGPSILYEYFGCEHLAQNLATIDEVRPARGLCFVSSGGDPVAQAAAFAVEIANAVVDAGLPIDSLAVDRFPFTAIDALRAQGFHISDADAVFSAARRIKLAGEIEVMREAMSRVVDASEMMVERIEPGSTENEIWAEFIGPFIATEGKYIATRLLQSGERSFPYFQEAGARKVQAGELICFDTDAIGFAGYCVDFSRSYLCGDQPATAVQRDLYSKAREQLEHNVDLIRAGAVYRDIAQAAWPIPAAHQDSRYYCVGHGLGMSGEFPNIPHLNDNCPYPIDGELEAGMVLCIESYIGCARSGQGVKLEDQLLITETGVERMSASSPFDERLMGRMF
jgi:Xaa-Pro aminopeptidase